MRPRVFIDFSLVDFRTNVTGIPRVAYAYLEEGHRLAGELGFEVQPVYVHPTSLVDARPFLHGFNWKQFKRSPATGFWPLVLSSLYFLLHGCRIVFVTLFVPLLVVLNALVNFAFFDFWKNQLSSGFKRVYDWLKNRINDGLGRRIKVRPGDVLFMPAYWHDTPPGFYKLLQREGLKICPMLHDILPITHREYYESPWKEQFRLFVFEIIKSADHVFYISEYTRLALEKAMRAYGPVELPPGEVLLHGYDFAPVKPGASLSGAVKTVLKNPDPYFLMVGSIEPKKNHLKVIAEFETLWAKGSDARLVIVGRTGWKDQEIARVLNSHPQLHSHLVWLKGVDDASLAVLYAKTAGLIQASISEGFGLPIIEALACKAPVLVNDIAVFREIGGTFVSYFEIDVPDSLGAKVLEHAAAPKPATGFQWPTWHERARTLFTRLLELSQRKN